MNIRGAFSILANSRNFCAYFCMSGCHVRATTVSETFLQNVSNVMTSQGHVSNVTEGAILALPFKVIEF